MYVIQLRRFLFSAGSPILLFLSSAVRAEVPKTVLTCLGTRKRSRPRTNDFGSTPPKSTNSKGLFGDAKAQFQPISRHFSVLFRQPSLVQLLPLSEIWPGVTVYGHQTELQQSYHARYCTQVQRCRHTIGADSTSTSFLTRRTRGKKKSETRRTQSKKGSRDILSGKTSKTPLIARRKHSSCPPTASLQSPFLPS